MKSILKLIRLNKKSTLILYGLITLISTGLTLASPHATELFLDEILNGFSSQVIFYVVLLLALFVLVQVFGYLFDMV